MTVTPPSTPNMRPLLPLATRIVPYLKHIDANRYYSNRGPLVLKLEDRLRSLFQLPVITASSATSALTAAILALELPPNSLVACPAWTFVATPAAIVAAGHIPYFMDVNPVTQALHPLQFDAHSAPPAAVLPVAPFGDPYGIISAQWDNFVEQTNTPVIIDAAAGLDAFSHLPDARPTKIPVVFSTHCTKTFCTGEGGLVVSKDEKFLEAVRDRLNFGLMPDRTVASTGINGKMSEYHAAVGLAETEEWKRKREQWTLRKQIYHAALGYSFTRKDLFAQSTFNIAVPSSEIFRILHDLKDRGIDARRTSYGLAYTSEPYRTFPRDDLPHTRQLMEMQVSLPFSVDMSEEIIKHIARTVKEVLECSEI